MNPMQASCRRASHARRAPSGANAQADGDTARAKANISPAPAIASPAIPCPAARRLPAACKMGTPMGAIYSTNITPDPDTGIGNYTLAGFRSRGAVGRRQGRASPLSRHALSVLRQDQRRRYRTRSTTFFMKEVPPVKQANKPNEIPWYLNFALAAGDLERDLHAEGAAMSPSQDHDAAWNRGAYLVEGLGHCGACHTPRGWAFQEKALDDEQRRLSPRRRARCLVRAQSARRRAHRSRRLVAGRYRGVPQDRPQRQGRRLRLDARRRQQQHAVSQPTTTSTRWRSF